MTNLVGERTRIGQRSLTTAVRDSTVGAWPGVAGAALVTRHSLWIVPVAFVGLVLLPMIPALIHNTRVTGRPVLPRTAPVDAD